MFSFAPTLLLENTYSPGCLCCGEQMQLCIFNALSAISGSRHGRTLQSRGLPLVAIAAAARTFILKDLASLLWLQHLWQGGAGTSFCSMGSARAGRVSCHLAAVLTFFPPSMLPKFQRGGLTSEVSKGKTEEQDFVGKKGVCGINLSEMQEKYSNAWEKVEDTYVDFRKDRVDGLLMRLPGCKPALFK